jgi:hypothetical protein
MRKSFGFTYNYTSAEVGVCVEEYAWRWHWLAYAADAVCALSRHRLCQSLVMWAYNKVDEHVVFSAGFPSTKEQWVAYAAATGAEDPSWRWEDEDDEPEVVPELARALKRPRLFRWID